MIRTRTLSLTLLLFFLPLVACAQTDKVNEFVKAEMQKRKIPGLSIAVVKDGQLD
jgi:CubicO group peptidase (beta-lactamase class C family)